jgi:hypothetical protein
VRLTIGTPRTFVHLPATKESRQRICRELREAVIKLGNQEGQEWENQESAVLPDPGFFISPEVP